MTQHKVCPTCQRELPLETFRTRRGGYPQAHCRDCKYEYNKKRARDSKKKAIAHLGGKCSRCGIVGPPCIYDFHHVDPDQKVDLGGRGIQKWLYRTWARAVTEVDKCVLLCSNCHREVHNGETT